jgi:hypothetical protein
MLRTAIPILLTDESVRADILSFRGKMFQSCIKPDQICEEGEDVRRVRQEEGVRRCSQQGERRYSLRVLDAHLLHLLGLLALLTDSSAMCGRCT